MFVFLIICSNIRVNYSYMVLDSVKFPESRILTHNIVVCGNYVDRQKEYEARIVSGMSTSRRVRYRKEQSESNHDRKK